LIEYGITLNSKIRSGGTLCWLLERSQATHEVYGRALVTFSMIDHLVVHVINCMVSFRHPSDDLALLKSGE
jgi:hypothetical protein